MASKKQQKQRGVTLIELMVVIVIIGVLGTIVVFNVLPAADTAKVQTAETNIDRLESAVEQYALDIGQVPTQAQGLRALVEQPQGLRRAARYRPGGYIDSLPVDPWGNAYIYIRPGQNGRPFDIVSYGRDGRPGGEGLDADIASFQK